MGDGAEETLLAADVATENIELDRTVGKGVALAFVIAVEELEVEPLQNAVSFTALILCQLPLWSVQL